LHTDLYEKHYQASIGEKYVVEVTESAKITVYEKQTHEALAILIGLAERDWLVVTPEGLFDGSPTAWGRILWRFNNNTFDHAPVEVFFTDFYYPGLLTDIFAGKRPKASSDISQKDRRQTRVTLALADARPNVTLT